MPPPPHLRRPFPGPGMLHPDPFGAGVRPSHGAFPGDMVLHPEIMEQKLVAQEEDMHSLFTENRRLAATHSVLRHELAAAQQELQRVEAQMDAMKAGHEQRMSGLANKMAKMEADLKGSETIRAELQQAHAEANSLVLAREELMAKVHHLTQDLQTNHADGQQVSALVSELDNLKQDYQHCRATYDYERKLRIEHYESLQVMEKNYMSMVREVEKLRAELTNATNLDRSGGSYNNSSGYKESDTTGQRLGGQNAYEDVYGAPQGRGPSGGSAVAYGGAPPGARPAGHDAPARGGPVYDAPRNSAYDAGYDNSRGGSFEPPKGAAAGHEVPKGGPGYDATVAANKGAGGAQVPAAAGNVAGPYGATQTVSPHGSAQAPSPYRSAQAPNPYGSGQAPNPYGSGQAQNSYGSSQAQNPYGSSQAQNPYGSSQAQNQYGSQAPNPYGSAQAPNPYGSAQAQNPYGSGSAQAQNPYGSTQAQNPYGSAQAQNPYGSAQAQNPYGSAQAPNAYGSAQAPNTYGSAQAPNPYGAAQAPPVGGAGFDAPPRGGGGGGAHR